MPSKPESPRHRWPSLDLCRYNFPGFLRWSVVNSISFLLAVQVFYYASAITLVVTFLDQSTPARDASYVIGALLLLTAAIPLVGALIGLILGAYQCQLLHQFGVKRNTWLLAATAGAAGGYGYFVYSQFVRAYLAGLQSLFDPSLFQCIVAAAVMCTGIWYVFHRYRLSSALWIGTTIVALGAAIYAAYALRHAVLVVLAATLAIGIVYSALLYRSLALMHRRSSAKI